MKLQFATITTLLLMQLATLRVANLTNLRCENRKNPLGIDVQQPRLSWVMVDSFEEPMVRNQKQTAYQILVASSETLLKQNQGDCWDSGKVVTDQSIAVRYSGLPLISETRYWWKVRVWDKADQPAAWSEPATFLTGKLNAGEWLGKWIGPSIVKTNRTHGAIYLRKDFDLKKPVVRAVLSFSGLGFSEVNIDGMKVGDYVIGPGFTDYDHQVPYLTFDVTTNFSMPGHKQLDVTIADGWYALERDPWVHQLEKKPYVDLPKLLLDLRLIQADGTETVVRSDESWKWSTGEITRSWIAQEDIDLRQAGEMARNWQPVVLVKGPRGKLEHQKESFNQIVEEVRPASVHFDAKTGTATYEIGHEVNGWVRFRAHGPAGTTIYITTIPSDPKRPRTSQFILAGGGSKETYEPRFFHAGMAHVKISGLVEESTLEDLTICRVSSMHTPAGAFSCSDEFVNWLEQAVRRTVVNYTTFLPNDPVREWKAWTQDIQNMFGSAFYLFAESQVMYERWEHDLLDSQNVEGNMANVAPGPVFDPYNSPWWGGCGVWLPWEWRLAYGDDSLLRESYPAMKRYVDFLEKQAATSGGLQKWGLKDWLCVEETPIGIINTPAHFRYAQIVSWTAAMLGKQDESMKYAEMAERVKSTFNNEYLDPQTGIYGEKGGKVPVTNTVWWVGDRPCTEAGQVMPLALGLVPETARPAVVAALQRDIVAHKGRLSTGFVSTPYLLDVLTDIDPEMCWRLVTARAFPSWYSMTHGSGNDLLKEKWDGGMALMPSLGGCVARWCYWGLAGIRPDPTEPGFKKIIIKPAIVGELTWVKAYFDSSYGRIVSNWQRDGNLLTMDVTIPPNTTAMVYVPSKEVASVTESGKPAAEAEGVTYLRMETNAAVYAVGSGNYRFQSKLP